jgi:hypothetical protein
MFVDDAGIAIMATTMRLIRCAPIVPHCSNTEEEEGMKLQRDRSAINPGGMQCEDCDEILIGIFIGEEWHSWCAICTAKRAALLPTPKERKG